MRGVIVILILALSGCNVSGYQVRGAIEVCKLRESTLFDINADVFECSDGYVGANPERPD